MTTIYLGGPINGCTDDEANGWRDGFKDSMPLSFHFKDPMVRDYRGREDECVDEIVELDKEDTDDSNIVLCYCWKPSPGTSMEIFYAWERWKLVVLVIPPGERVSPWYRYHSYAIVGTLNEARNLILDLTRLNREHETIVRTA